jgi:myo-inositol-1(or 4)-monophosphatase
MQERTSYISAAKEIAQEAGDKLVGYFGNIQIKDRKSKSPADVVTKLDIETENFIAEKLGLLDPEIGFLGEESGERKSADKFWLVDPIDGTSHFVRGIPYCTTMIALVEGSEVTASIIYNFVTKELFEAEKSGSAKLNGQPISVSERKLSDSYLFVESDLSSEELIKDYIELKNKCTVLATINCGYEFGLIASGKIEGRVSMNPYGKDWDYAPGSLLVRQAGGKVANIGAATYDYKNHNFLAVNPEVHKELTEGPSALFPIVK